MFDKILIANRGAERPQAASLTLRRAQRAAISPRSTIDV